MDHRGQHAGRPPAAGAAQPGSVEGKAPCETKRDTGLRQLQSVLLCTHTHVRTYACTGDALRSLSCCEKAASGECGETQPHTAQNR